MKAVYFLLVLLGICKINAYADTAPATNSERVITQVTSKNFSQIISSKKPVVIDVYADWCGPCKMFAPTFDEVQKEESQYDFAKLNGDEEESLRDQLKVEAYPTVIFFKDGKEVGRYEGLLSKEKFQEKLKNYLNKQ